MSRASGGASRAAWEIKLQQLQEDLERREAFVATQEKRLATLQSRADDINRREMAVAQREDYVAHLEEEFRSVEPKIADLDVRERRVTENEQDCEARRVELSDAQLQFAADAEHQRGAIEAAAADLALRRERLDRDIAAHAAQVEADHAALDERTAELSEKAEDVLASRNQASLAQRAADDQLAKVRQREEQVESQDRLVKELLEQDVASRKVIKATEMDLQRRGAQLAVAEQHLTREQRDLAAGQREHAEAVDKYSAVERSIRERDVQLADRQREMDRRELQLDERAAALEAAEADAARRSKELEAAEARLADAQIEADRRTRSAEIDSKRATLDRERCVERERDNADLRDRLQQWERELHEWMNELSWREGEFASTAHAALNETTQSANGSLPVSAAQYNRALVDVQMERVRSQYDAAQKRRAISALHPMQRAARSRPATAQGRPADTSRDDEPLVAARPNTPSDAAVMQRSEHLQLEHKVEHLSRAFRSLVATALQPPGEQSAGHEPVPAVFSELSSHESVVVQLALARERDLGAEVCLRAFIAKCPLPTSGDTTADQHPRSRSVSPAADVTASQASPGTSQSRRSRPPSAAPGSRPATADASGRMTSAEWWRRLRHHLDARQDAMLRERLQGLDRAVQILERAYGSETQATVPVVKRPPRPGTAPARAVA